MSDPIDYTTLKHFHLTEGLTDALMAKTGQQQPHFFRLLAAYFFSLISANMRVSVLTKDRGPFPVNAYVVNLAPSGFHKGHSVSIINDNVMAPFMSNFLSTTMPIIAENRLLALAGERALISGETEEDEHLKILKEFHSTGPYLPVFDSGTPAAFKQLREHLIIADSGCLHMRTDELGTNLTSIEEILAAFIEAFDVGLINPKLIKHTDQQKRITSNQGRTPAVWLGFGTPTRVLDGSRTEQIFMDQLQTGFARRCFFGHSDDEQWGTEMSAQDIFNVRTNSKSNDFLTQLGKDLAKCAEMPNHRKNILMSKDRSIQLIEYELRNKELAACLPDHRDIEKTELLHRHAKVLKLAGAYAFVNGDSEITEEVLLAAIRMGEDSGSHFEKIMQQEPNHARLCKYIGSAGKSLTQAELIENVPYYRGSEVVKRDMMTLAVAYGLRNNISIKRTFTKGVEEIEGTMLRTTDTNKIHFSYSSDISQGYRSSTAPFTMMHKLLCMPDMHWTAHSFKQGHRHSDDVIPGFDLLILDVDDGMSIDTVKLLLAEYTYCIHTTKSHGLIKAKGGGTIDKYRIVLPMSHMLKLTPEEHSLFMEAIFDSLPFKVDQATKDIGRKWCTAQGQHWYNEGKLWDVLPFIPDTTSAEERQEIVSKLYSLSHLERWFATHTGKGNRSNSLYRYGAMLIDSGLDLDSTQSAVEELNDKLPEPLKADELITTIYRSLARKQIEKESKDAND